MDRLASPQLIFWASIPTDWRSGYFQPTIIKTDPKPQPISRCEDTSIPLERKDAISRQATQAVVTSSVLKRCPPCFWNIFHLPTREHNASPFFGCKSSLETFSAWFGPGIIHPSGHLLSYYGLVHLNLLSGIITPGLLKTFRRFAHSIIRLPSHTGHTILFFFTSLHVNIPPNELHDPFSFTLPTVWPIMKICSWRWFLTSLSWNSQQIVHVSQLFIVAHFIS